MKGEHDHAVKITKAKVEDGFRLLIANIVRAIPIIEPMMLMGFTFYFYT